MQAHGKPVMKMLTDLGDDIVLRQHLQTVPEVSAKQKRPDGHRANNNRGDSQRHQRPPDDSR